MVIFFIFYGIRVCSLIIIYKLMLGFLIFMKIPTKHWFKVAGSWLPPATPLVYVSFTRFVHENYDQYRVVGETYAADATAAVVVLVLGLLERA